ncbi:transketolase [Paenibacillus elgii]|uniref:Transketolase n=1 Tax=Paenibacillus elgii TaxID=189691 RepID=A0A2T6G6W2_9BACL|nr:transketolase [Paenibacillus elgii]PUA39896.1 transketolase [Paenibacillus elgii]
MSNETIVNIKKSILHMTHYSKSSHVGTALSIVDILYTLYFKIMNVDPSTPKMQNRDKFILSKGHGSVALYATLAEKGFFNKEILDKYYVDHGILPGHLDMEAAPGIELSTGSLGHGLSVGVGMAIANKVDKNDGKVYVVLGDGECNEGSVWEAVMLAATLKLNNVTAIIDYNKLQGFGRTNEIINQENMAERWKAFGWNVVEVDGHNLQQLEDAFYSENEGPKAIIAHTIKGSGVSFMADRLDWHYRSPNEEQLLAAIKELDGTL